MSVSRSAVALVAAAFAVNACVMGGAPSPRPGAVAVLTIPAPIAEPVWSRNAHALFALTAAGSRVARIDPMRLTGEQQAEMVTSEAFVDTGENVVAGIVRDVVWLAQPHRGRVLALTTDDLRRKHTLPAGESPSFLALDSGSDHLLALAANRSTVTPIDLHTGDRLPPVAVETGSEAEVDGAKRGRRIDFHLTGLAGIKHFKGSPGAVTMKGGSEIGVESSAGDLVKPSRIYVAEQGTNRLLAVESHRWGAGLHTVASLRLDAPVLHVGVDETRVYAATENRLVVLKTDSFEGYDNNTFEVVATVEFRDSLEGATAKAPLSGLAVGSERVYLTFEDARSIVGIEKPEL